MRRTALGLGFLMSCALTAAPSSADQPDRGPAPLGSMVQVALNAPAASQLVLIGADVSLPGGCLRSSAIQVAGTADAVLIDLRPADGSANEAFSFGRLPDGATFDSGCGPRTIKAGRYTLTALRTDGTATVTLALPGLNGSDVTLAPSEPSEAEIAALRLVTPAQGALVTGAYATDIALASTGRTMVVGGVTASGISATILRGTCEYAPGQSRPGPEPVAYAAPCPAASGTRGVSAGSSTIHMSIATGQKPGIHGMGFYYIGANDLIGSALTATLPDA